MAKLKIEIADSYFAVYPNDFIVREIIEVFKDYFLTYALVKKNKKFFKEVDREFYSSLKTRNKFIFIKEALPSFVDLLKGAKFTMNDIEIVNIEPYPSRKLNLKPHPIYKARDKQVPYVENMVKTKETFTLVNAPTGSGKTIMACLALQKINKATMIIVKPAYIAKWIFDIKDATTATDSDLLVIKDTKHLIATIEAVQNNEISPAFILISNRLLILYIKEYENAIMDDMFKYPYPPGEIGKLLKIGVGLVDEIHEEFHSIFKILMYMNFKKTIGLSATLETNDKEIRNMHYLLFPSRNRLQFMTDNKYINVTALEYKINNKQGVRYDAPGDRGYSHIVFEQSILKNRQWLANYLKMILATTETYFMKKRRDGDKLMIFAASIDMCIAITRFLDKHYKTLDVRKYTSDDPYENVIEPDIRVSTVGKSGTAIDIPGLTTVIQTINILSIVSNVQTIGRLRELPGREVNFVYFFTPSINKHSEYHRRRQSMLKRKAKKYVVKSYHGFIK